MATLLPSADSQHAQSFLSRYFAGRFSSPKLLTALAGARAEVSDNVLRARIGAVCAADFSNELCRIQVPILYLRASQDRIVPHSACERIRRLVPTVRVVELKGPHYMLQACAPASAAAIRDFAREIGAR